MGSIPNTITSLAPNSKRSSGFSVWVLPSWVTQPVAKLRTPNGLVRNRLVFSLWLTFPTTAVAWPTTTRTYLKGTALTVSALVLTVLKVVLGPASTYEVWCSFHTADVKSAVRKESEGSASLPSSPWRTFACPHSDDSTVVTHAQR